MNQSKFGHFLTGTLIGVGLGVLLAPKAGTETRENLRKSFKELTDTIKNIDIEKTKSDFLSPFICSDANIWYDFKNLQFCHFSFGVEYGIFFL